MKNVVYVPQEREGQRIKEEEMMLWKMKEYEVVENAERA